MPGRYLNVRVPPPFIVSIISGGYPCSRRRRAPASPEYRSAILICALAMYVPIVSQDTRSMSSSPRLVNRYLALTSGLSSGQPSSTQAFHPLRSIGPRSEEHTSELQSPCISYAVFCLKKKK